MEWNIFSGDGPADERGGEILHQEQEGEHLGGLRGRVRQQSREQRSVTDLSIIQINQQLDEI